MVHLEDAQVTHHAVRGACRLYLLASGALLTPYLFQVIESLVSILEKRLKLCGDPLKSLFILFPLVISPTISTIIYLDIVDILKGFPMTLPPIFHS